MEEGLKCGVPKMWLCQDLTDATGPPREQTQYLRHRWLQNFETTQAKIEGWGLFGVEKGVVLIMWVWPFC